MWPRFIRRLTGTNCARDAQAEEINRDRQAKLTSKLAEFDFVQSATERLVRQLGEDIPR